MADMSKAPDAECTDCGGSGVTYQTERRCSCKASAIADAPEQRHLWECRHPYYCNEGNYFAPGNEQPNTEYKSFAEFLAEWGDADFDYNLLFRWDWVEGEDYDLPPFNGDVNYRNGILKIFWMGQRKGKYLWSTVEVCRADEPAVRAFLEPRWQHLQELWDGIAPPVNQGGPTGSPKGVAPGTSPSPVEGEKK